MRIIFTYTSILKTLTVLDFELEMANKPVPVGIARTRPRFDGESPH